jgi:ABC-2 type transport system ATP-binding protein
MTAILECCGLTRTFGRVRAVDHLDVAIREGELYGLVGPDGAGKTTTMRLCAGLLAPSEGSVRVLGVDPTRNDRAVREAIGYMPQQYSLYGDLSVGENLRFFARMFGLERDVEQSRRDRLLEITRLAPFKDRRAEALSGGMYKKLALACALLHRPRLLLLDEPTNGVDPVSRRELWALLHEFLSEGMAVVVSTPYMDEAERCHRVGLIDGGRLIAEGAPRDLVAAFDDECFEVGGGARDDVLAALDACDAVRSRSPAGARLRVVCARGRLSELEAAVAGANVSLAPIAPTFEDVFITQARARHDAARPAPP